jgi:cysteinyl-tRNA synthetase
MSAKYLGATFDLHGGGIDNIFPHNECEIAQSEAAHHQLFARFWLLGGSLTVDGVKMSKSLGNFLTIKDALRRWKPEAIRFFILSGHYRNPIDFSDGALEAAAKGWERLVAPALAVRERLRASGLGDGSSGEVTAALAEAKAQCLAALNDDFNAPAAIAALFDLAKVINTLLNGETAPGRATLEAIDAFYREMGGQVLGLLPAQATAAVDAEREAGLIRLLLQMRTEARARKDFAQSDAIRDRLKDLGVLLEDGKDGTTWKFV